MYKECLKLAEKETKIKLCPRGYCTAKSKYSVYPSAYANGYASQVCSGKKPDYQGYTFNEYTGVKDKHNDLSRWYQEQWVNVCEKNYPTCGRNNATMDMKTYPYCRPIHKLTGTKVKSVGEMTKKEIQIMCKKKRSIQPGINHRPTRVYINK